MKQDEIIGRIREACRERKVCRVHLSGESDDRLINPHGICYSNKNKLMIVSIFVKGFSESNNPSLYRNLLLDNCEEVEVLSKHFTIDSQFNPGNAQYKNWKFHVLDFDTVQK
jgi:hypothetical protein